MGDTCRWDENRPRNRRQGVLSRGQSSHSQFSPAATAIDEFFSLSSTQQAREVTQQPTCSSGEEGHEPSASWAARMNWKPRATDS